MKNCILFTTLFFLSFTSVAQDCFAPGSNHVLYTTTDAAYGPPAISGFVTLGPTLSGQWSTTGTSGSAGLTFSDISGRTSTFSITGEGTVTVANTSTDINTGAETSCEQTFTVSEFTSSIAPNPPVPGPCPLDVVLVIDESESIATNMSVDVVRSAISTLATSLGSSGSSLAIVEFDTRARRVMLNGSDELQVVDASLLTAVDDYLANDYNPVGDVNNLVGGTNWEDALTQANAVANASLIVMLTDGRPTFYNTGMGMNGVSGEGLLFDLTALSQAQAIANTIKNAGKHIFVSGIDFPSQAQPILDISGSVEYTLGQDPELLLSSDYALIPPGELATLFEDFSGACLPERIPTLGEWAIINLALIMMILGIIAVREPKVSIA